MRALRPSESTFSSHALDDHRLPHQTTPNRALGHVLAADAVLRSVLRRSTSDVLDSRRGDDLVRSYLESEQRGSKIG